MGRYMNNNLNPHNCDTPSTYDCVLKIGQKDGIKFSCPSNKVDELKDAVYKVLML
jgi:hypothetical protein